jgi:hypothetical protein
LQRLKICDNRGMIGGQRADRSRTYDKVPKRD